MEYYQGYLIPVNTAQNSSNLCHRRTHRSKSKSKHREMQRQLSKLKLRIKNFEKDREKQNQLEERKYGSHQIQKEIRVETIYMDEDIKAQNIRLRQQNKILNQYFTYYSQLYRKQKDEMKMLKQENQYLLENARKDGDLNKGKVFSRVREIVNPKSKKAYQDVDVKLIYSSQNQQNDQTYLSPKISPSRIKNRQSEETKASRASFYDQIKEDIATGESEFSKKYFR